MLVPHFKYCMKFLSASLNREWKWFQEGKKDLWHELSPYLESSNAWNASMYKKKVSLGATATETFKIFSGNISHKD